MCLAVPGRILEVEQQADNRLGTIQFGGVTRRAYLDFVPEANVGDYVIVHVGFAISRVDAEEARRTWDLLRQMDQLREEGLATSDEGGP